MSARHRSPKHRATGDRKFRLASMESLGFIDKPGGGDIWTTSPVMVAPPPAQPTQKPKTDPFDEWEPNEVGKKLHSRNFRWSTVVTTFLIVALIATAGYWIYQQPARNAADAAANLSIAATELKPEVTGLLDHDFVSDIEAVLAVLPTVDQHARDLFNTSGALPPSLGGDRLLAADAAGLTLDASRSLKDAYAYRAAVIPILALPTLETDPELIDLEDAARTFGTWQARFVETSESLPGGAMGIVGDSLVDFGATLETTQRAYLDALREDDPAAAGLVVSGLVDSLGNFETLLETTLSDIVRNARGDLETAELALAELLG